MIFISIIIILLFVFSTNNKTILIDKPTYIHSNYTKEISPDKLENSKDGIKFSYTFWIHIKNIPENANWETKFKTYKYIIYRFGSPNILYFPKKNILRFQMTFKDELSDVSKDYIDMENIPTQKWNYIAMTLDEKNLDIYLNGELYGSMKLSNVPFIYQRFLLIGHRKANFNGHIAKLNYYNDCLDHHMIKEEYEYNKESLPKNMNSYSKEYYFKKKEQ